MKYLAAVMSILVVLSALGFYHSITPNVGDKNDAQERLACRRLDELFHQRDDAVDEEERVKLSAEIRREMDALIEYRRANHPPGVTARP